MAKRGPKPNRELSIARARCSALHARLEERPKIEAIASLFGVSRRQVELCYAKHREVVESEWNAKMTAHLTSRLSALDRMTKPERAANREARDSRLTYEISLAGIRERQRQLRSRKKLK